MFLNWLIKNKLYNQKSTIKFLTSKIMRSGARLSIPKQNQNHNNRKRDVQTPIFDPFDEEYAKGSFTDAMKADVKKRVPFLEILNQEEQERENQKSFKKSSIGYIPNQRIQSIFSSHDDNPKTVSLKQKESSIKSECSNKFTEEGQNSIQLISVIESVTISSRSSDKKSSEIHKEKSYKLEINEQAIKQLLEMQFSQNSTQKVSFCTVVGKTKTGKSFLLNKLINSSQKDQTPTFSVNHTLDSCTKGIWISKQSIKNRKNNEDKSILILDTAGFGSYNSTQEIDYKLMTLSILLSDVLMYNSIGPIDEHMLNGMSLAVEISKMITKQQQKSQTSDKIFTFPTLYWILRDFSLQLLTKEKKKITQEEYLEKCLKVENDQKNYTSVSNKTKSKNNIREAIKSIFTNRKCSILVTPFDEEGKIRSEFYEGLVQIKNKLSSIVNGLKDNLPSKTNSNKIQEFVFKLRAFVELLNVEDSTTSNVSKKGSFSFPKLQSLETSFNKVKLLHEFKKINEEYESLFKKFEENLEKVQQTVDTKERYLNKVQKLRQKMENQISQARNQFKQKIQKLLNIKSSLTTSNKSGETSHNKTLQIQDLININLKQFERNSSESDNLIKVIKQNYQSQCSTLRLRFEQIELKIQKNSQTRKHDHNKEEQRTLCASKIVNEKIESFREMNSIAELKKQFQKTIKDLKNLFHESQQSKQLKKWQKQLQDHYLQQKINLMQASHLQLSTKSNNFDESSLLQKQGYESCSNCQKSFYIPYIIIPTPDLLRLKILKTIVKQMHREYTQGVESVLDTSKAGQAFCDIRKTKLQFIIEVQLNSKKWFIRRKLKDFVQLNSIISIMFTQQNDNLVYPTIQRVANPKSTYLNSMLKLTSLASPNDFSEDRVRKTKQELEGFLVQLNRLDYVRNSRIYQKFVKINKQYLDL